MRFRESVPRGSSSCGISFRRDRPHPRARLADAARPRRLCRDRARQCRAGARDRRRRSSWSPPESPPWRPRCAFPPVRSRSSSSAGGGGVCDSTRSIAACSRPRSVARPRATVVVTGPVRKTPFALRVPAEVRRVRFAHASRASPARASRRPLTSAGRHPRPARHDRRSARCGGRLRRTRLAGAPRRPRRAARR